jgi:hypothetical protein
MYALLLATARTDLIDTFYQSSLHKPDLSVQIILVYSELMKDILVKRSSAGLGLFANKLFKKGDEITEYIGETITTDEGNRRGGKYLFELNGNWMIDGKDRSNIARYANHSCRPNASPVLSDDETQVKIFAKKTITVGEEITINYGPEYFNMVIQPAGCLCEKCTAKK